MSDSDKIWNPSGNNATAADADMGLRLMLTAAAAADEDGVPQLERRTSQQLTIRM